MKSFSPEFFDSKNEKLNHALSMTLSNDNLLSITPGSPNSSYILRMKRQVQNSRRNPRPQTLHIVNRANLGQMPSSSTKQATEEEIKNKLVGKVKEYSQKVFEANSVSYVDPGTLLERFRQKDLDEINMKYGNNDTVSSSTTQKQSGKEERFSEHMITVDVGVSKWVGAGFYGFLHRDDRFHVCILKM